MTAEREREGDRRMRPGVARAAGGVLIALAMLLAGCGGGGSPKAQEGLTPAEFVDIVVALREAEREMEPGDTAGPSFEDRKREILAAHDATEAEVRAFVERHASDYDLLTTAWDSITQRLRYVPSQSRDGSGPVTTRSRPQ